MRLPHPIKTRCFQSFLPQLGSSSHNSNSNSNLRNYLLNRRSLSRRHGDSRSNLNLTATATKATRRAKTLSSIEGNYRATISAIAAIAAMLI